MYHTRQENFEMILVLYNEGFWRHKRRQKIWLTHLTLCQTLKILCIGATAFMLFLWIKLFMNEKDENEHWNFYKSTTCLSNTGYLQTFFWISFFENFMKRFFFFCCFKTRIEKCKKDRYCYFYVPHLSVHIDTNYLADVVVDGMQPPHID